MMQLYGHQSNCSNKTIELTSNSYQFKVVALNGKEQNLGVSKRVIRKIEIKRYHSKWGQTHENTMRDYTMERTFGEWSPLQFF